MKSSLFIWLAKSFALSERLIINCIPALLINLSTTGALLCWLSQGEAERYKIFSFKFPTLTTLKLANSASVFVPCSSE